MVEPKYQIKWTSQYKKDIKLAKKRHYKIEELQKVVFSLANALPQIGRASCRERV